MRSEADVFRRHASAAAGTVRGHLAEPCAGSAPDRECARRMPAAYRQVQLAQLGHDATVSGQAANARTRPVSSVSITATVVPSALRQHSAAEIPARRACRERCAATRSSTAGGARSDTPGAPAMPGSLRQGGCARCTRCSCKLITLNAQVSTNPTGSSVKRRNACQNADTRSSPRPQMSMPSISANRCNSVADAALAAGHEASARAARARPACRERPSPSRDRCWPAPSTARGSRVPISAIASSGRPPISPHSATGTLVAPASLDHLPQRPQERRRQRVEPPGDPLVARDRPRTNTAAGRCCRPTRNPPSASRRRAGTAATAPRS